MADLEQSRVIRILIVEDEKTTATVMRVLLKEKFSAEVALAYDCASAREQMGSSTFDLITFDYQLPDGDGLELLAELTSREDHPPAIMVTGHGDEQTAVEAFKRGAAGYVVKDHRMRTLLVEEAERVIGFVRAASALKESEQHLRMIADTMMDVITQHDSRRRYLYASPSIERMFGYRPEELLGQANEDLVHPEDREMVFTALTEGIKRQGPSVKLVYRYRHKNGEYRWVSSNCRLLYDEEGVLSNTVLSTRDITDRKRADELVLAQRDLAVELGGVTDLPRVIELALDAALASSGLEAGGVYVADSDTGALDLVCHKGLSPEFIETVAHFERSGLQAAVVFAGEPMYAQHAQLLALDEVLKKEGLHFLGMVPLRYEGEVVGCLNIASHVLDDIPDQRKIAVETLAGLIGQAVGRSRLLSALKASERRYRLLYEGISEPLFTYDRHLILTEVNSAACEAIAYDLEEMVGRHVFEVGILHPDDVERVAEGAQSLFSREQVVRDNYRFIRKDGKIRIGDVTSTAIRDEAGKLIAVTNVVIDVTEEKLAKEALVESEELYRTLVATSPDFITLLDIEGNVLALSDGAVEAFGVTVDSARGKFYIEMLDESQQDTASRSLKELMEKGTLRGVEYEIPAADGSTVFIESNSSLVHDSKGEPRAIMSVSRDITDRKKAEKELRLTEERYKALFEQAPMSVIVFDSEFKITQCNERLVEILRSSRERLIGLDIRGLKDKNALPALLGALEGRVSAYEGPYEATTSDVSLYIIGIASPLRDVDGRVVGGILVVQDITDRKKAEEQLRLTEERYKALFEQAPAGVVVFDGVPKVTQCNERMAEIMRSSRDSLIGFDLNKLRDKRVLPAALEALEGRAAVYEGPYEVTTSGESLYVIAISSPLRDVDGRVVGGISVVQDVTDSVRADESLRRANEELRGYAHTVSHDLKGPLSATVTAAELLRDALKSDNPARCSDLADLIVRTLRKTSSRIDELLVLAKAGQQPVEPVDVRVCSVIGDVQTDLDALIEDKRATIKCDPDLGRVRANRTQIYQVFSNLILNALKHGKGDNLTVEVLYLGKDDDGAHRYLVRDNGPGIPAGMERDIFRPFFKGAETGETGIGLSIVQRIVEAYGGEIRAYSDNGACFEFTLIGREEGRPT